LGERGEGLTAALLDAAAQEILGRPLGLSDAEVRAILDPKAVVATRQGPGGAAPEQVRAMIDEVRQAVETAEAWQGETAARVAQAEERLVRLAEERVG